MTQIIINETTPVVVEVSTPGPQGSSGTATVGTVTTGASGSAAAVTNSGTPSAAVFNFTIPKGDIGDVTPAATAAKNAAEAAAIAAAASELAAETAEQAAEDSATAAQSSATSASASATTATTKAQEATTSASNAAASAQSVSTAATTATAKAAEAAASATAALSSANTASTKAQEAADSATTANTKAQEAVVSATTATNKATEASASAASALSAQQVTTDNATLAIAQANIAGAKAAAANTSANDALVQASVATAQAAEATTQANTATTQAGIATTQATTATTQAGIASTQANTAIAQAAIATTKASEASVSASNSQGSASAALASQTASAASATAANTSAGNASGSAASALAIYGTTSAQQAALANAQSAASLAQGYALSASSAIQQDLSGVTAQALHRSPNAVTAMFVYDTSKDSDGGAWTEKCQHTSWYNEPLNGKWLGAQTSEFQARNAGATVSATELVTNGDFSNGTTGWTQYTGTFSVSGGVASFVPNSTGESTFYRTVSVVIGKTYLLTVDVLSVGAGVTLCGVQVGTSYAGAARSNNGITGTTPVAGQKSLVFVATASTLFVQFVTAGSVSASALDNISVREVTALTTASGDYYQSTVDGKFYKLNPTSGVTETFRGNKADFPRLAGIVAEAANVTIYDLTEAGRPMWMRFASINTDSLTILGAWFPMSAVAAINGVIGIGSSGLYGAFRAVNMLKDTASMYRYNTNFSGTQGHWKGLLVNRNQNIGYQHAPLTLAGDVVNAVAMTVLPDAPVDPVTGLKVPTIAVATAGGVSIIKHNGTVVNSGETASFQSIILTEKLLSVGSTSSSLFRYALSPGLLGASFAMVQQASPPAFGTGNTTGLISSTRSELLRRSDTAATVQKLKNFESNPAKGVAVTVTNTFNTGHLLGDIRRAYLADVDVGSVSGTELVTNGTFDTDTTGWTGELGGVLSVVSNALRITNGAASEGRAVQAITTVVGKSYCLRGNVANSTFGNLRVSVNANGSSPFAGTSLGVGAKVFVFTALTTTTYVVAALGTSGLGSTADFDNISVKETIVDRSYKTQGADITGTLTKSQVASAAQLVAYSGFSASNYLREPYSADLDFGTGEWSVGAWVNVPAVLPVASFPLVGSQTAADNLGAAPWAVPGSGSVSGGTWSGMSQYAPMNVFGAFTTGKFYLFNITVTAQTGNFAVLGVDGSVVYKQLSVGTNTMIARATAVSLALLSQSVGGSITISQFRWQEVDASLIADRAHSSGAKISLGINAGGFLTATAFDGTTTRTVTTTAAYNTATWIKPEAVYTTDGTLAIRVNGVEVAAARGTPLLTLNNSSAVLTIGNSFAADAPFPGSISLLKLSATVPTSEQSQWMYEQEKQMFRDGAQVTLPDSGSIVDLAYDDATDKWLAVSATNESEWSGLVRTSVTAVPAGSYSKISASSGIQLQARTTTNPGVDVTIPSYGLREELVNRSQAAARLARSLVPFDYIAGFTANTTSGSTAITSAAGITYPVSYIGARVSGSGIPADTFVAAVSGTTVYLTKAATATASTVQISFNDFILPVGYEAKDVLLAGVSQREGATQAFIRLFDGFKETIRFTTAPSNTAFVQIQATRSIQ